MKSELKENMYVRTIDGIMKVKNIYQDGRENMDRFENEDGNIYFLNEIIGEPSFNPIDLIEVGDYVNGYKVISIGINDNHKNVELYVANQGNDELVLEQDIKSIVTKEQFESMEYKIGDSNE